MKKMVCLLALCVAFACSSAGDAARAEFSAIELTPECFIGRWHDYPVLGNGWSDNLNFYADGTFIFLGHIGEAQRYEGTWKIEDNRLEVDLTSADLLIGADLIADDGGSYLEGGRSIALTLEPPVALRYGIEDLKLQNDHGDVEDEEYYTHGHIDGRPVMRFGGVPYWRIMDSPVVRETMPTRELIEGAWSDEWDVWGSATWGETDESYYYGVGETVPDDATLTFLMFRADGTCSLGWRHGKADEDADKAGVRARPSGDEIYEGTWALDASEWRTIHIELTRHETLSGASLVRTADGFAFEGGVREDRALGELTAFDYDIQQFGHFDDFESDNPQAPLRAYFAAYEQRDMNAGYVQKIS